MALPRQAGRRFNPLARLTAATATLALVAVVGTVQPATAATLGADGRPITNGKGVTFGIISHRGGSLERPENSVEAYEYSVEQGFDVIETDLLFTSDGHGVMIHNDRIPARCTKAGQQIHRLTLAQVRQVRCEDFRTGRKTVPIPTFEEFATVVKDADIRIILDIKTYGGQPASGEATYARRAVTLLKKYHLLDRTTILTFRWATTLPTIRKLAPKIRVIGLDNKPMDLSRVRLAAKLGADGFGIKTAHSPVNLMRYITSLGMDPTPWEIVGEQFLSYAIHVGGRQQGLSSDTPAATRADLLAGRININPRAKSVVTRLAKEVTVGKSATYKANQRRYVQVMGKAVPSRKLAMLDTVKVRITVTKGKGKGYLHIGAANSPLSSSVKVKIPRGTKSVWVKTPVGDGGKVRIYASKKLTYKVRVVEYTNLSFS